MENTAIHFLIEQLTAIGQLEIPEGSNVVTSIIQEANEIFEEQIMDAFIGFDSYTDDNIKVAKQYYQETFKSE